MLAYQVLEQLVAVGKRRRIVYAQRANVCRWRICCSIPKFIVLFHMTGPLSKTGVSHRNSTMLCQTYVRLEVIVYMLPELYIGQRIRGSRIKHTSSKQDPYVGCRAARRTIRKVSALVFVVQDAEDNCFDALQ